MFESDINLSRKEMNYLRDSDFLLTQVEISRKIKQLLRVTEKKIKKNIPEFQNKFPEGTLNTAGKLSKGNAYRQLPYFVLDYPRNFSVTGVFAFRTMCWWGNFFSITFHLQGIYLKQFREALAEGFPELQRSDYYFCVNATPWEYHYKKENYQHFKNVSEKDFIHQIEKKEFIKISQKLALDEWIKVPEMAEKFFKNMLQLL